MAQRPYALLIFAALSFTPAALPAADQTTDGTAKSSPSAATAAKKPAKKSTPAAAKAQSSAAPAAKTAAKPKLIAKRAPVGEAAPEEAESNDIDPIAQSGAARSSGDAAASAAELD